MKSQLGVLLLVVLCGLAGDARAAWVNLSQHLPEADIQALGVDAKNANILYAASERKLYKTADAGLSWKQILSVKGPTNRIHAIYVDLRDAKNLYVAGSNGIRRSQDGGSHWTDIYKGMGNSAKQVFCITGDFKNARDLWAGTEDGLLRLTVDGKSVTKMTGLPRSAVRSIETQAENPDILFAVTDEGIYQSIDHGKHWKRQWSNPAKREEESSLQQFEIEELSTAAYLPNIVFSAKQNKFYAATPRGIFESRNGSWEAITGQSLPNQKINRVVSSARNLYAATDKGVYQWDESTSLMRDFSAGLGSAQVRTLHYNSAGDYLLAGTKKGLYRFSHPEFGTALSPKEWGVETGPVLDRFKSEPTIHEIQEIAIRYAEVHPDKIEAWRKAASRKALLPTLSLGTDMGSNQNVDLDRGGTADPDQFIQGPKEKSLDWSVGVSWNLGELIWNDDQTTIDNRSRLMVELRDDILNEVTHLYYERRRLQAEMAMTPVLDVPTQIEKEIRLDELTAQIDALTGGYLSKNLK